MLIELGPSGFISFQAKLFPERLILILGSDTLQPMADNQEPLEPSGVYFYQDPMRGALPQFCVHPFEPEPVSKDGQTTWTWFSEPIGDVFWSIDLIREEDSSWACGLSCHEDDELDEEDSIQDVFSVWIQLPGYAFEHSTQDESQSEAGSNILPFSKRDHRVN
jgi:hypothetical protein